MFLFPVDIFLNLSIYIYNKYAQLKLSVFQYFDLLLRTDNDNEPRFMPFNYFSFELYYTAEDENELETFF